MWCSCRKSKEYRRNAPTRYASSDTRAVSVRAAAGVVADALLAATAVVAAALPPPFRLQVRAGYEAGEQLLEAVEPAEFPSYFLAPASYFPKPSYFPNQRARHQNAFPRPYYHCCLRPAGLALLLLLLLLLLPPPLLNLLLSPHSRGLASWRRRAFVVATGA